MKYISVLMLLLATISLLPTSAENADPSRYLSREKEAKRDEKMKETKEKSIMEPENNNDNKEEKKKEKDKAAEVAAALKEATDALTIELEDIAKNNHRGDVPPEVGFEYLSGKPRKGKPGPKKQEREKKVKKKVKKHTRKNDAKAVKPNHRNSPHARVKLDDPAVSKRKTHKHRDIDAKTDKPNNRNSHVKVADGNLEASKTEKEGNHHAMTLEAVMKAAAALQNVAKGGKARKI